jgi:hypothetical protein
MSLLRALLGPKNLEVTCFWRCVDILGTDDITLRDVFSRGIYANEEDLGLEFQQAWESVFLSKEPYR